MEFTYGSNTLDASGNLAPTEISANLEQKGSILRTIIGRGVTNLIWSKWSYSFTWTDTLDEVGTKLQAMQAHDGYISFEDSNLHNITCYLVDDSLTVLTSDFGKVSASAIFREV